MSKPTLPASGMNKIFDVCVCVKIAMQMYSVSAFTSKSDLTNIH